MSRHGVQPILAGALCFFVLFSSSHAWPVIRNYESDEDLGKAMELTPGLLYGKDPNETSRPEAEKYYLKYLARSQNNQQNARVLGLLGSMYSEGARPQFGEPKDLEKAGAYFAQAVAQDPEGLSWPLLIARSGAIRYGQDSPDMRRWRKEDVKWQAEKYKDRPDEYLRAIAEERDNENMYAIRGLAGEYLYLRAITQEDIKTRGRPVTPLHSREDEIARMTETIRDLIEMTEENALRLACSTPSEEVVKGDMRSDLMLQEIVKGAPGTPLAAKAQERLDKIAEMRIKHAIGESSPEIELAALLPATPPPLLEQSPAPIPATAPVGKPASSSATVFQESPPSARVDPAVVAGIAAPAVLLLVLGGTWLRRFGKPSRPSPGS